MTAPPRTKEIYNNMMYTAAAYLVENKTNTPFDEYLVQNIFKPLGMNSTYLHPKNTRAAGLGDRIASGYSWLEDEKRYIPVSCIDMPEAIGAGNIMSSVDDAIKYIKAMIDHQSEPITESVYNGIVRGRMITDSLEDPLQPLTSPAIYASGWQVSYYRGHCIIEHDGSEAGYASVHFFLPDLKFGGVIYGNSGGIGYVGPVLKHELIDELLNVPKDERPDWNKIESGAKDDEEETDEAKIREIYPDIKEIGAQEKPLDLYTGVYMNPGYHNVRVTIKDGNLFIDASDRSMGFYLRFQHVSGQTDYVAWQSDWLEGGNEPIKAEFKFGPDGGHANVVGIKLEGSTDELIYFNWQKEIA
ncbi:hypothetical protein H072_9856 [Dactylellina haptotyla CBS 200.50]|uniref:Beta-lactamase-related domain-containing protein n=1 Tax=Dactylellina haptotyla (strain CBS 200.50) TaxID=1284197 RepID=S8A1L2_DACHA|nr:hypothetical protein H072_9856 [Dactylellina haptotyla CBS 200.50]